MFRLHKAYVAWFDAAQPVGSSRLPLGGKQFAQALDRLGYTEIKVGGARRRGGIVLKSDEPQ